MPKSVIVVLVASAVSVLWTVRLQEQTFVKRDWPFYGGDQGGMKYSPLKEFR